MSLQNETGQENWYYVFDCQEQPTEVFCKKGVPKNFTKLTEKYLCLSPSLARYLKNMKIYKDSENLPRQDKTKTLFSRTAG